MRTRKNYLRDDVDDDAAVVGMATKWIYFLKSKPKPIIVCREAIF